MFFGNKVGQVHSFGNKVGQGHSFGSKMKSNRLSAINNIGHHEPRSVEVTRSDSNAFSLTHHGKSDPVSSGLERRQASSKYEDSLINNFA